MQSCELLSNALSTEHNPQIGRNDPFLEGPSLGLPDSSSLIVRGPILENPIHWIVMAAWPQSNLSETLHDLPRAA
jgi:hypothetical protein